MFRRALGDTWSLIHRDRQSRVFWLVSLLVSLLVGFVLGFLFLDEEEVKDEAVIMSLFTLAPLGVIAIVVFLWNLWLAPHKLMGDKLGEVASHIHSLGTVAKVPEEPDVERWKRVTSLKLYQVAELCAGISPGVTYLGERFNDASKAIYSELEAALHLGDLKIGNGWANADTLIKREDLQKYFSGRDDCPEFLKE